MTKRARKIDSGRAYSSYIKKIGSASVLHSPPVIVRHFVFVATCSGSVRLGGEIGLPLGCIGVSPDPSMTVHKMREARHGALVPSHRKPFESEPGWDDWNLVPLIPEMARGVRLPDGVSLLDGVLAFSADRRVPNAEVNLALAEALRHLRFHEVACSGNAVRSRHAAGAPPVIAPRYTSLCAYGTELGRRVDDLYACDVWHSLSRLAVAVEAAALQARMRFLPNS